MDIPRKSAKRMKMIRRGLIATVGLVVVAAVTVGVSRLKPAAPAPVAQAASPVATEAPKATVPLAPAVST